MFPIDDTLPNNFLFCCRYPECLSYGGDGAVYPLFDVNISNDKLCKQMMLR